MLSEDPCTFAFRGRITLSHDSSLCFFLAQVVFNCYLYPVITVVPVEPKTELLTAVRELWRRHSDTLVFFPEGAFDDHANKGCILAAIGSDGHLRGYILFRTTHNRKASIAHLCVDTKARGQGLARQLFGAAKNSMQACDFIIVRCRRDFAANELWPRLGFVAVREELGRGKIAQTVTIWKHEINRLPLLKVLDKHHDDRMRVVIDANVFLTWMTNLARLRARSRNRFWQIG